MYYSQKCRYTLYIIYTYTYDFKIFHTTLSSMFDSCSLSASIFSVITDPWAKVGWYSHSLLGMNFPWSLGFLASQWVVYSLLIILCKYRNFTEEGWEMHYSINIMASLEVSLILSCNVFLPKFYLQRHRANDNVRHRFHLVEWALNLIIKMLVTQMMLMWLLHQWACISRMVLL